MSVTTLSRVTSHPLSHCPDPTRPDPTHKDFRSSFSSIVTAVEGDKRMAAIAARFGGV